MRARVPPVVPTLLAVLASTLALALAGCTIGDDDGGDDAEPAAETAAATTEQSTTTTTRAGSASSSSFDDIPELVEELQPSVVSIVLDGGEGSGVIVDEDTIVTNAHVAGGARRVQVVLAS